jgi:hypothetical protein
VEVLPVIPTIWYVNIGELPEIGAIDELVYKVIKVPTLTVPETEGLMDVADKVNIVPDEILEFEAIKLGFIVNADVV